MSARTAPLRVSLVATPDTQIAPMSGLFEALNAFDLLANFEPGVPRHPFQVEIVAGTKEPVGRAESLSVGVHRTYEEVDRTDIVIVPLMMVDGAQWTTGRYPEVIDWLRTMHRSGAALCSTCTGVLLLAETGFLDGLEATIHWAFAETFRQKFPNVRLRTEEVLIVAGDRQEFVMTGGVVSWHDLALYLIARNVGPDAAHAIARLLMLQWHGEGQAPYVAFSPNVNHGDALISQLQTWLQAHYMVANPVEELVHLAALPRRSLERRFSRATGHSPIAYVQALRVEQAKRRLERTRAPIDEIGCEIGYENAAYFRRLFKRVTQMTPGAYRRRFQMPQLKSGTY